MQLSVEPEGAELAAPSRDFEAAPQACVRAWMDCASIAARIYPLKSK